MKKIFYGVGQGIMRDFRDKKKLITLCDMQDLTIESSASQEDVTGGDKITPIASFDKEKEVKISATNATFEERMMDYLEGADQTVGTVVFPGIMELTIDETAKVVLEDTPLENSIIINDFTEVTGDSADVEAGKYKVDTATKTITFSADDIGKDIVIFYEYNSSADTLGYGVKQTSMKKPFEFIYKHSIHDEDSQIVGTLVIVIYKARCTSGFSIDPKHLTPMAPKFEAKALDPKRADKHIWDYFLDMKK